MSLKGDIRATQIEQYLKLGSAVGASERLKIVRSPVRSRPKPPVTSTKKSSL
jgi:hypothetical protein